MRVVDTSAWLEWLGGGPLGVKVGESLPPLAEWIVPTIVQHELMRHVTRLASRHAAHQAIAFSMRCIIFPVDARVAVRGAEFAAAHALAMADALIYACAVESGADLLTCDAHFAQLPGVVYLPKTDS